jgi:hypothetical protein
LVVRNNYRLLVFQRIYCLFFNVLLFLFSNGTFILYYAFFQMSIHFLKYFIFYLKYTVTLSFRCFLRLHSVISMLSFLGIKVNTFFSFFSSFLSPFFF